MSRAHRGIAGRTLISPRISIRGQRFFGGGKETTRMTDLEGCARRMISNDMPVLGERR